MRAGRDLSFDAGMLVLLGRVPGRGRCNRETGWAADRGSGQE